MLIRYLNRIRNFILKKVKVCLGVKIPIRIPMYFGDILRGRSILITGGASGIGYEIAKACLRNGASVIIAARNEVRLKEATQKLNREFPGQVDYVVMDLNDYGKFEQTIVQAVGKTPNKYIDTLINNAGVSQGQPFGNTTKESLDLVFDTNVKGVYIFSQSFARYLIANKIAGNIHNVCSSSSNRPASSPYSISKWAEAGLTKGIAKSLIKHNIVVNAVAPGPTAAGMMLNVAAGDLNRAKSPAGRFVTAEEIANLVVFLISNTARMIIGEIVYITGGAGTITFDDVNYNFKL